MLYDGSVCFFILYHYKSNSILATPIVGLDNVSIYNVYKKQFELLTSKGFKPKLIIMDNQATKHIKTFLTKNDCKMQLVEPHNNCVNATERTIQTFKDAFMAALATTDSNFPLQMWDRLTQQIQDTLNLLCASCIDSSKSAYEILNRPYNRNRSPWLPLGARPFSTKMETLVDHGHQEELTLGISDHPQTIINVIIITQSKQELTVYLDQQNCSHNTINFLK
jgi:hypothetical protein